MLIEIIAVFLGISILFYCLFAGADFGAGILEFFLGKKKREEQQELISHAIAPVWEANHVWLILAVVILFNGFPKAYSGLTTTFHIPLTLMLVGVIMRGCAFTFRHYDVIHDRSQKIYTGIFMVSSVLTPLMLGITAGGVLLGRFAPPESGFFESFISPWLNLFCFSTGVFTCAIFSFLAAVYLIGEARGAEEVRDIFVKRARASNIAVVVIGACVFLCAELDGFNLISLFAKEKTSVSCMVLATLLLVPLWKSLAHRNVWSARVLAAAQMCLVLLGWFMLQYPVLFGTVTIYNGAAPQAVLQPLLYALLVGCSIIFPAIFYLMLVFKRSGREAR